MENGARQGPSHGAAARRPRYAAGAVQRTQAQCSIGSRRGCDGRRRGNVGLEQAVGAGWARQRRRESKCGDFRVLARLHHSLSARCSRNTKSCIGSVPPPHYTKVTRRSNELRVHATLALTGTRHQARHERLIGTRLAQPPAIAHVHDRTSRMTCPPLPGCLPEPFDIPAHGPHDAFSASARMNAAGLCPNPPFNKLPRDVTSTGT
jgi:hypothetical protein